MGGNHTTYKGGFCLRPYAKEYIVPLSRGDRIMNENGKIASSDMAADDSCVPDCQRPVQLPYV